MAKDKPENKMIKRTYIQIKGELASPLLIGSGENMQADMDVIRDHSGHPFIPGTACAGAFRQWLVETEKDDERISSLFGANKNSDDFSQSRLFISDTVLTNWGVTVRDHVHLEDKVVKDTGKFDVEVVETGAQFTMNLECIERESSKGNHDEQLIYSFIGGLATGKLKLGGKTSRGYGKVTITEVTKKVFDYATDDVIQEWLNWDLSKGNMDVVERNLYEKGSLMIRTLVVPLKVKQTLLIRDYKTDGDLDYTYLTSNGHPVIPGTTWAGAFRQRLQDILKTLAVESARQTEIISELFGSKKEQEQGMPSLLQFEESTVQNYTPLTRTRNAIDRFSGATIDGALFTGESVCKGDTKLVIRWRKNDRVSDEVVQGILYWLLQDLHHGFLAIGGESSIGRGVFELKDEYILGNYSKGCGKAMDYCFGRLNEVES